MKKLLPILMLVALTAGCGSGIINTDCETSYENFCDGSILYRVDLCGNSTAMGQCEYGCNLEFTACLGDCNTILSPNPAGNASVYAPVATGEHMVSMDFQELPQIKPYDR